MDLVEFTLVNGASGTTAEPKIGDDMLRDGRLYSVFSLASSFVVGYLELSPLLIDEKTMKLKRQAASAP